MILSTDTPTVLWQLRKGAEVFTCAVRLTPPGLRLEQSIGDQRLVSQTYQTGDELYAQANVVRQQCLEDGWTEDRGTHAPRAHPLKLASHLQHVAQPEACERLLRLSTQPKRS
jgi:hypothetical protein